MKRIRSSTWVQKTQQRSKSGRRISQLPLGMSVTYSIAQQDHPYCCIQLAEYRCSKAEFVFYKISTWDHICLCHTFKCWISLFTFNICPWGQKGLYINSSPRACLSQVAGVIARHRAVLVWSTQWVSASEHRFSLNREETIWALSLSCTQW